MISEGEIWLVNFPLEEDPTQFLPRPVIVLNVNLPEMARVLILCLMEQNMWVSLGMAKRMAKVLLHGLMEP